MIALVTGASGGIGRELARLLARDGHELILVARRRDLLEGLAGETGNARVLTADLSDHSAPAAIVEQVPDVDILVNNAGHGDFGRFGESDRRRQLAMIDVNVRALTELTHRYVPGMLERRRGRILNVASLAAFQPGPLMAVYYATKAYVLSFSEALHEELRGSGVTVTALCPGPTASGFFDVARIPRNRLVSARGLPSSTQVASEGYRAMLRGRAVAVTGLGNRVLATSVRLAPRALVRRAVHRIQRPLLPEKPEGGISGSR